MDVYASTEVTPWAMLAEHTAASLVLFPCFVKPEFSNLRTHLDVISSLVKIVPPAATTTKNMETRTVSSEQPDASVAETVPTEPSLSVRNFLRRRHFLNVRLGTSQFSIRIVYWRPQWRMNKFRRKSAGVIVHSAS